MRRRVLPGGVPKNNLGLLGAVVSARCTASQNARWDDVHVIHLVGGGELSAELCQLTVDACGIPVMAGPVEAAALGNALMQMVSLGELSSDLNSLREVVRRSSATTTYDPSTQMQSRWEEAEGRMVSFGG